MCVLAEEKETSIIDEVCVSTAEMRIVISARGL